VGDVVGLGEVEAVGLDDGDPEVCAGADECATAGACRGVNDPPSLPSGAGEGLRYGGARWTVEAFLVDAGAAGWFPAARATRVPAVAATTTAATASTRVTTRRERPGGLTAGGRWVVTAFSVAGMVGLGSENQAAGPASSSDPMIHGSTPPVGVVLSALARSATA
jgi:hypothetical protein